MAAGIPRSVAFGPYESYTYFVYGEAAVLAPIWPIVLWSNRPGKNIGMLPRRRPSGSPVEQRYEDTAPAVKGLADAET